MDFLSNYLRDARVDTTRAESKCIAMTAMLRLDAANLSTLLDKDGKPVPTRLPFGARA